MHLCFSSSVSASDLTRIGSNDKLADRVVSVLDVNCNFSVVEDNIFGVSSPNVHSNKKEDVVSLITS